ncbi:hypothetical protein HMPREF9413_4013 [Paenibacillus sp. HGF7]|nr:hypothetical protein HMPREF9413_4013 [Paenibacillus sp. HGF7]
MRIRLRKAPWTLRCPEHPKLPLMREVLDRDPTRAKAAKHGTAALARQRPK